jgi:RNA polymerase sigma-70 factor (ECF subfamily)
VTCCHPALDRPAQVALTLRPALRPVDGGGGACVPGQRSDDGRPDHRAKKKIAVARIPYRVPPAAELPARIDAVLSVVHLLFTTGHTVRPGDELVRRDLVERSMELCRMLRRLLPRDPAVAGLLALLLLTDARRETRTTPDGRLAAARGAGPCPVGPRSDRRGVCPWSARLCAPGHPRATLCRRPSRRHASRPAWQDTDWREVVALYDVLVRLWPSPVVASQPGGRSRLRVGPAAGSPL